MFDKKLPNLTSLEDLDQCLNGAVTAAEGDIGTFRQGVEPVLASLVASPALFRSAIERCIGPDAPGGCERDEDAVKLVLWRCPRTKSALRIHRFLGVGPDRPHSHRWPFVARILKGAYHHAIFGVDGELRDGLSLNDLHLITDRVELPGVTYALDHRVVHLVDAGKDTLSLVYRGPARADRLLVIDHSKGDTYWHFSTAQADQSPNRYTKALTTEAIGEEVSRVIAKLGL